MGTSPRLACSPAACPRIVPEFRVWVLLLILLLPSSPPATGSLRLVHDHVLRLIDSGPTVQYPPSSLVVECSCLLPSLRIRILSQSTHQHQQTRKSQA
ncbi:uncharacterized protein BDZ83DRAFT_623436 [Colletotrichum acutatum]|uniref:Secreted protein n=1 Tax=Glomerella acutata TaxID=27357 RepID=A0AAD8UK41_GLOAC|nr:uncharacterized protein BDZ83DRAFT_623436 [Colletotrichum acutatum]KAK1724237.1 hypothetical protein BDZ83DRAFT_623436 [Colletotrichum acutatum]